MTRLHRLAIVFALALLATGTVLVAVPSGGSARASAGSSPSPAAKAHAASQHASTAIVACPSPYTQGFQKAPKNVPAGCPGPCAALGILTPATMGGLTVGREDPCGDFQSSNTARALNGVALFSLREPTQLLIATLEVGRFAPSAPIGDAGFRDGVISQIGSTAPQPLWLDGHEVFATSTTGLTLICWFKGRYMFVLAVRNNYDQPKSILRDALKVNP
jgi:hypothetical protein